MLFLAPTAALRDSYRESNFSADGCSFRRRWGPVKNRLTPRTTETNSQVCICWGLCDVSLISAVNVKVIALNVISWLKVPSFLKAEHVQAATILKGCWKAQYIYIHEQNNLEGKLHTQFASGAFNGKKHTEDVTTGFTEETSTKDKFRTAGTLQQRSP